MNYGQEILKINKKIINEEWNFTDNELYLIKRDYELKNTCLTMFEVNKNIIDYILPVALSWLQTNNNHFPEQFCYQCVKRILASPENDTPELNLEYLKNIVSKTEYLNILEVIKNYFQTVNINDYKEKIDLNKEIILMLIELKRFDILNKTKIPHYLRLSFTKNEALIVLKEFPFTEYDLPIFASSNLKDLFNIIEDYSTMNLMPLSYLFTYYGNETILHEEKAKIAKLIDYKLANEKWTFKDTDIGYLEYLSDKNPQEKIELGLKALDHGYVNLFLNLLSYPIFGEEEYILFNEENINKFLKILASYPDEVIVTNLSSIVSLKYLFTKEKIRKAFIKNTNIINFLNKIDNAVIKSETKEEVINQVIEEIENNNPHYKDTRLNGIFFNEGIIDALLAQHNYSFLNYNFTMTCPKRLVKKICFKIYNSLTKEDFTLTRDTKSFYWLLYDYNPNFFNDLIFNQKFADFLNMAMPTVLHENIILNEEAQTILGDYLANNYAYADKLLRNKEFIFNAPIILNTYFTKLPFLIPNIINYMYDEDDDVMYTLENYNIIKKYFIKEYNLNGKHLDFLAQKFGYRIIKYLGFSNLNLIVNFDDEEFFRLMDILTIHDFTITDAENIYDALKQHEFAKDNYEKINIFPRLMYALENKRGYSHDYIELLSNLNKDFIQKFQHTYPEYHNISNCKEIIDSILINIIEGQDKEKNIEMLHFICQYYIAKKREEYRQKSNMYEELEIKYEYDAKDYESKFTKYLLSYINDPMLEKLRYVLCKSLKHKGLSESLINDCLNYFSPKDNIVFQNSEQEIKQNIKTVILTLKNIYPNLIDRDLLRELKYEFQYFKKVKKHYYFDKEDIDIYNFLINLNIPNLEKNVLSDPEVCNSLLKTLNKYKLFNLPNNFQKLLAKLNIDFKFIYLSSFVSFYDKIYKKQKDNMGLLTVLKSAEIYSSVSSVYAQILGQEDMNLIKLNPKPYSSPQNRELRLKNSVELTKNNFLRTNVAIPTFNETFELKDGKKLQVIVGNFTHPSNLTHGERTGSCMRLGGIGDSLYKFTLTNPFGFHIRFMDPSTHEYVSRASGFRNGNTVFLNQLRYSCLKKYDNNDLVEACSKASKRLLELSKESTCPIENVVVSCAFATSYCKLSRTYLDIQNIKDGLPVFYSDISGNEVVYVLASNRKEGLVPINLDNSQVPYYLPAREKTVMGYSTAELYPLVNRIYAIDKILKKENYEYIDSYYLEQEIVYGLANQDWFVFVDEAGVIHKMIIGYDKRAQEEYQEAQKIVSKYIENIEIKRSEVQNYGL